MTGPEDTEGQWWYTKHVSRTAYRRVRRILDLADAQQIGTHREHHWLDRIARYEDIEDILTSSVAEEVIFDGFAIRGVTKDGETVITISEANLTATDRDFRKALRRHDNARRVTNVRTVPVVVAETMPEELALRYRDQVKIIIMPDKDHE